MELTLINQGIKSLINGSSPLVGMPIPFENDIFLIETHIAGTSFKKLKELDSNININDKLILKRDINNKYDQNAIIISTQSGIKLGFVPKEENLILANLLSAGKMLFAKITKKEWRGTWLYIEINIFLNDI